MIRRDMEEVLAIERASFADPWTEEDFRKCLLVRDVVGVVVELDGPGHPVLAYVVYQLHPARIEVLNLAVHPEHRRAGIGRMLVGRLRQKLHAQRRRLLGVDVEERNLSAHLFCRACGLRAIRVIPRRYGHLDAYRFVLDVRSEVSGARCQVSGARE